MKPFPKMLGCCVKMFILIENSTKDSFLKKKYLYAYLKFNASGFAKDIDN